MIVAVAALTLLAVGLSREFAVTRTDAAETLALVGLPKPVGAVTRTVAALTLALVSEPSCVSAVTRTLAAETLAAVGEPRSAGVAPAAARLKRIREREPVDTRGRATG